MYYRYSITVLNFLQCVSWQIFFVTKLNVSFIIDIFMFFFFFVTFLHFLQLKPGCGAKGVKGAGCGGGELGLELYLWDVRSCEKGFGVVWGNAGSCEERGWVRFRGQISW